MSPVSYHSSPSGHRAEQMKIDKQLAIRKLYSVFSILNQAVTKNLKNWILLLPVRLMEAYCDVQKGLTIMSSWPVSTLYCSDTTPLAMTEGALQLELMRDRMRR